MSPAWLAPYQHRRSGKLVRKPTDTLADYIPRLGATPSVQVVNHAVA
jgi:hypothetical protein